MDQLPINELTGRVQRVESDIDKLTRLATDTNNGVKRIEGFLAGDEMTNQDGLIRRVKILEGLAVSRLEILQSHEEMIDESHTKTGALREDMDNRFDEFENRPLAERDRLKSMLLVGVIGFSSAGFLEVLKGISGFVYSVLTTKH
jgi:hypothetical protein